MAVRDGVVAWLGGDEVGRRMFPDADVEDLEDGFVAPGFVDSHIHLTATGLTLSGLDLRPATSYAQCLQMVADYAAAHPGQPVWGHGWDETSWPENAPPSTGDLDAVLGDRPAYLARVDAHSALASTGLRRLVGELPPMPPPLRDRAPPREPARPVTDIYGLVQRDARKPTPTRELLQCLLDGGVLSEFKPEFGETLVTGFARIGGWQVGVLANDGVLFTESGVKAAHFIDLCCKRNVPLVFLADVAGFMVGQEAEQGGIAKAGAKFITAMSSASVPKFTIITGGAYGAGYLAMCGRAFQPNAMFMWPNGRAAIMGPEQAATTLALVKRQNLKPGETSDAQAEEAFKDPIRRQYETFAAARNFARHLWVDGILDPAETRETLTLLLDLAARVPAEPTRFGVFRM